MSIKTLPWSILMILLVAGLVACSPSNLMKTSSIIITPQPTQQTASPKITISIPTNTVSPFPSATKTITFTSTPDFIEPEGCLQPIEDYKLVSINGMTINQRTYSMLEHAQSIYQGEIDLTGYHLNQGSYSNLVSASFGTHAGGGAVDLSVIQYGTYQVLYDDIELLIAALRVSGFEAWLRDFDQLYPGSPIHIHAIAIGDRELSGPAVEQLTGKFGYFRGFDGIPQSDGYLPIEDEHGGPVICQWMLDMGYEDLSNLHP